MKMIQSRLVFAVIAIGIVAAACGDDDTSTDAFPTSSDPSGPVPTAALRPINAIIAGSEWIVGDNNFVIGITNEDDEPQGGATVKATFFDLRDPANAVAMYTVPGVQSAPGVGPVVDHTHASGDTHTHGGQDDNRVGYYFDVEFPHAGQWGVAIEATLKDGTDGLSRVSFNVADRPSIVTPGQKAPLSDNLTAAEVDDITLIDSGEPPSDMHDVKIKDAIAAGRPLVIVFGTPAYCTSRFCGPVVEEMGLLRDEFNEEVDFVHIEIWSNFEAKQLLETVEEWIVRADGSLSEPFVYIVDNTGVVYDRWEGPVAGNIIRTAVEEVAAGATWLSR